MDIFKMLAILKDDNNAKFETNNGDIIGMYGVEKKLMFCDASFFFITPYNLNTMTFKRIKQID